MFAVLSVAAALIAAAEPSAAACPTPAAAAVPQAFAGWSSRQDLSASAKAADPVAQSLIPGRAVHLILKPASAVGYAMAPNPKDAGGFGGYAALTIKAAGTYRIAAGDAAWLDVLRDGQAVASNGHTHGPACSPVRKMVDFPLTPGRYVLQISGSPAPSIDLMAVAKP